jgi:hypothetical protein
MKVLEHPAVATSDELVPVLEALTRLKNGDPTVRLPLSWPGVVGKVADVFNEVVERNAAMAVELARLRQVVGKEGKLKQRASLPGARGFWAESLESVNSLIDDLVHPTSRASSCAPPRPSTRWSSSSATSRPRSRAWRARSAPRASSAARPR